MSDSSASSTRLTGLQIYEVLMGDEQMALSPAPTQLLWAEYCNVLVDLYNEEALNQLITAESFVTHRLTALRAFRDGGWGQRMGNSVPDEEYTSGDTTREEELATFGALLERTITELEAATMDIPGYLAAHQMTEEQFMYRPTGADLASSFETWQRGELTLRSLLTIEPHALFSILDATDTEKETMNTGREQLRADRARHAAPTTSLTAEQILGAIKAVPDFFDDTHKEVEGEWIALCEDLVTSLGDLFDAPVTMASALEARFKITERLVTFEWPRKYFDPMPSEAFDMMGSSKEKVIETMTNQLLFMGPSDQQMSVTTAGTLARLKMTEETFLIHPSGMRFNDKTLERWKQGGLTIGDLMLLQPGVLIVVVN